MPKSLPQHVHPSVGILLALFIVACVVSWPARVSANMAVPQPETRPGERVGEPLGDLKNLHIERETLLIDLRPLEDGRPALIEATYRVRNDGDARRLELVFVAAGLLPPEGAGGWVWRGGKWIQDEKAAQSVESGVWLDEQRVGDVSAATGDAELPKSWRAPATTPKLGSGIGELPYEVLNDGTLKFQLTLAPGQHSVRVRYAARPTAHSGTDSMAVYWQLGYVLAPARAWASFGGLDAKVLLPAKWRAVTSPEMRREGDALVASWSEVPADALSVTAQTTQRTVPDPTDFWLLMLIFGGLFTLASGFAGWKMGAWLGGLRRTSAWGLLLSPVVAVVAVVLAIIVAWVIAVTLFAPPASRQAAFNLVGNYDFILTFLLGICIFIASFILTQLCAFISRQRMNRKPG